MLGGMNVLIPGLRLDRPAIYCIKVQGRIDESWANWFGAVRMWVTQEVDQPPVTTMIGEVIDQAALHGWLSRLRDLGLPLLLVEYQPGAGERAE